MPIVLIPKESSVIAGGVVAFQAQVTAAKPGPMTLALKGPRGKPLPQERAIVIGADGRGAATFAPVAFAATSPTTTAVSCTVTDGPPDAAVAMVTIVPPADGFVARAIVIEEWPVAEIVMAGADPIATPRDLTAITTQRRKVKLNLKVKSKAKKPVAKKPVAKKPVAKKPVAKKPVAKKPVAKKPVAKKPAKRGGAR